MLGLQRRRGKAVQPDDDDETPRASSYSNPSRYDDDTPAPEPFLTLMEEVVLMGLKDKEGYLLFWNDSILYALRGCIVLELVFRGKIALANDPGRRRLELADRIVTVRDTKPTGEVLLDEALRIMAGEDNGQSITGWIDLLSGETWNLMKINYQLKQVRERLAKGLVDKGVLRTERKNFFLFDMATHPVADASAKQAVKKRLLNMVVARNVELDDTERFPAATRYRYLRLVALVAACYAANVLENAANDLGYEQRDTAFARADQILAVYGEFPFGTADNSLGCGLNLAQEVAREVEGKADVELEAIAAVIGVFGRMDSII